MNLKRIWLMALVVLVLVAACGPTISAPTPSGQATAPIQAPTEAATPVATQVVQATDTPVAPSDLPVDPNDWRTLGSADAKVTLIEYSDFQ